MRRIVTTLCIVLIAPISLGSQTRAEWKPTVDSNGGTVSVAAESGTLVRVISGGGQRCVWTVLHLDRDPGTEGFTEGDISFSREGIGPAMTQLIGGVDHTLYRTECPDGSVSDRWVPTGITVDDLIDTIRNTAEATVPVPVTNMNPAPDVGGIVNLGLWLAVESQTMQPLTAQAGSVWITLTPRLIGTRWEFGNGDSVSCDGIGVPIEEIHPDMDVQEESPTCGYTYRRSSPDDDPYVVTVTTLWELAYQSSSGAGSLPIMERSTSFDYDVDEIQTVGISN